MAATYRAALCLVEGDLTVTVAHADQALALAADDHQLSIAFASALLGLASRAAGELGVAHRSYLVAAENL